MAVGIVTTWTSASSRLPTMPSGSATPSWPSTTNSRGRTCSTSNSVGIGTDRAASRELWMSSREISRFFAVTATTCRLLKDFTEGPATPTTARSICAPAMISASSVARLIASTVAGTSMMAPLRAPLWTAVPFPRMSTRPPGWGSAISAQTFADPMSRLTRYGAFFGMKVLPQVFPRPAESGGAFRTMRPSKRRSASPEARE